MLVKGFQASFSEISRFLKAILPSKDKNLQFWLGLTLSELIKDLKISLPCANDDPNLIDTPQLRLVFTNIHTLQFNINPQPLKLPMSGGLRTSPPPYNLLEPPKIREERVAFY